MLISYMVSLFTASERLLSNAQSDLRKTGVWQGVTDLRTLMKDGAYINKKDWVILSEDDDVTSKTTEYFRKHLAATAINWAWHKQRVFLVSFPCDEDECKLKDRRRRVLRLILNSQFCFCRCRRQR